MWNGADIKNNDLRTKSPRRGPVLDQGSGRCDPLLQDKETRDASHHQEGRTGLRKMQNDEEWERSYETQAASLEPKPYPSLEPFEHIRGSS